MAIETIKNATFIYRLTLSNTITAPATELPELTIEQGIRKEFKDLDREYYLTLLGVKINRKIYQPVEIEAELEFMQKNTDTSSGDMVKAPSFSDVSGLLLNRQVKLEILQVTTASTQPTYTIAKDCYVYELNPQLKRDSNGVKMYVKMNIFSMDKLMTLNKYSKAYVARKLGSGILQPESLMFGKLKDDVPLIQSDVSSQRFLKYGSDDNKLEFIQPYLVQYNESFYDFLVRTSNRCGEFLYFEDGKLTLGLPDSGDTVTISDYESVTLQNVSADPLVVSSYARDSVKEKNGELTVYSEEELNQLKKAGKDFVENRGEDTILNHTVVNKMSNGFPLEAFPDNIVANSEIATDEYIFPLFKDHFSSIAREMFYYGDGNDIAMFQAMKAGKALFANQIDAVGGLLASTLGVGMAVDHGVQSFLSKNQRNAVNTTKNGVFITPFKNNAEQGNGNKAVQFSSMDTAGWTTLNYYNDIYKYEEAQQRKIVCINMGTSFIPVKLGQKIKVSGMDDTFVVIQIQQISEETWNHDYDKYNAAGDDKYSGKRSQVIYAIPSYKNGDNECFIPPVQPVPIVRKAGPQTAFVTANEDPKFQGRVRIAYPWQSEGSGLKAQLAEAEHNLTMVDNTVKKLEDRKKELEDRYQAMKRALEELEKYVNATPEERKQMLAERTQKSTQLAEEISKLETDKKEKKEKLAKLEQKEEKTDEDKSKMDFLKARLSAIETELEEKKAEKKLIDDQMSDMMAAAKEHDQRNGRDNTYKDIEKDNTVVKRYKFYCDTVHQQLRDTEEELERAKKEKETATDDRNQKATAVTQKIADMSSPWVRIATPMATPGGGTFFRPRVGDEVLVNYDCDNIERPYVVGSFFSKNTLTPDERYYRKQSPELQWKDISMSISSPNGHHISFTDPEKGGSFITNLISPGLGFYGSIVGYNNIAKGGKDLAGGIHIGDRYGIYEIEMKSHKRAIDIKSPFGTVNINAFTGITISAPNGDVTIKGKNIKLEAGNKVTINSGTNLPQPGCGDAPATKTKVNDIAKLIAEGVAGAVTDMFVTTIVDLSTIRHIIEVFVRPVDGTTLIKSRKFLRLEAGLGTATIKRDKYKKGTKDSQEIEQEFYKALCDRVRYVNSQMTLYIESYLSMRGSFFSTRSKYFHLMKSVFKAEDVKSIPNVGEKAKQNHANKTANYDFTMDDFNSQIKDHLKENLQYKGTDYTTDEQKYNLIKPALMAYYQVTYRIYDYCTPEHLESFFTYGDDGEYDWLNTAMKTAAKDSWISQQFTKWKDVFYEDLMDEAIVANNQEDPMSEYNKKFFRRSFIMNYLRKVYDSPENKMEQLAAPTGKISKLVNMFKEANTNYKYIHIGYEMKDVTNRAKLDLSVDYWWKRQIKIIDRWSQQSWIRGLYDNSAKKLIGAFLDNTVGMWKKETDRQVWNSDLNGQILFSDREDSTLSFEGEGLHKETDANQGNIDHLKWILRDM